MSDEPLDIIIGETTALDMIIKEVNNSVKSEGGVNDPTEEGGLGSGRNPEGPGDVGVGNQGPLVTFETSIIKEMLDAKLNCPCQKNKK